MLKVKCVAKYNDKILLRPVEEGEIVEVTEDRAEVLVNAKKCIILDTPTTEVDTEKAPAKKKTSKKK